MIHRADRIIIPPGSVLRSQLTVEKVGTKDGPRTLVLPASVEADPARTINILPPVAGKVVESWSSSETASPKASRWP